jgi:hypothetical protein
MSKSPPSSPSHGAAGVQHKHIQTFFDTTRGQVTIGEIPPIRCAALAAVGKKVHVALVCRTHETVDQLLQRLDTALGTALADGVAIDEVLPEIKRLRG